MTSVNEGSGRDPHHSGHLPPSLRFQLLLIVNGVMALLVACFLFLDYHRELGDHLRQKRTALHEEAKTILPAISRLRPTGIERVQAYLDAVCSRMSNSDSPRHHIAVRVGDTVIQSTVHRQSSPVLFTAIENAARAQENGIQLRHDSRLVGRASKGDVIVYVSEETIGLRRLVVQQVIWRLAAIAGMAVIAALLVSSLLLHLIANPVTRLTDMVAKISHSNFQCEAGEMKSRELSILSAAIGEMRDTLQQEAARRSTQMRKAQQIQQHLLPRDPVADGLKLQILYHPADDIAGDYFDVLPLQDGTCLLCVADVCGHGIPAAMSAALLKALLVHGAENLVEPDELLQFVNERFVTLSPPGHFASMVLVRWQPAASQFSYASAGHEPAQFRKADGSMQQLEATGVPLGILAGARWVREEISTACGERLLLTTDGVAEAMSPGGELFGRDRVASLMAASDQTDLATLVESLKGSLQGHRRGEPATDDATVLIVEFTGNPSASRLEKLRTTAVPLVRPSNAGRGGGQSN